MNTPHRGPVLRLAAVFFLLSDLSWAAMPPLKTSELMLSTGHPLGAEFLDDPDCRLTWEEASSPGRGYSPMTTPIQSFGQKKGAMWFRAKLVEVPMTSPLCLVAWGTLLNHLDVWFLDDQGKLITAYRAGDAEEPDPGMPSSLAFQFHVPRVSSTTILMRIQTEGAMVYQMYLWDRDSLNRNLELQNLFVGFLLGFMSLMVLINVLFRFSLNDKRFLWYAAYVCAMLFFLLVYTGTLRSLVLPLRFPQDIWDVGSLGLLEVVALWFCRNANRLHSYRGNLGFTWAGTVAAGLGTILGLIGEKNLGLLILNGTMVTSALGCWGFVAVQAWKGDRFARFFLTAWSIPIVSGILLAVQAVFASGWTGFNPYYLLAVGVIFETLILTFSFSDQVTRWHRTIQTRLGESYHEDRLISLGLVAAKVGHEVNTPNHVIGLTLTSMDTEAKALISDVSRPAKERLEDWERLWKEHSSALRTASRQIGAVIESLHSGRTKPKVPPSLCQLSEIVEETCTVHRLRWEVRNRKILLILDTSVRVTAFPIRLQQLLVNLVDNAAAALGPNEGSIRIRVAKGEGVALLTVTDDGRGMDERQVERLGKPFFSTKEDQENHGLGWGICQEIAREHRGTLAVSSTPGQGTTVTVTLPLERAAGGTELAGKR